MAAAGSALAHALCRAGPSSCDSDDAGSSNRTLNQCKTPATAPPPHLCLVSLPLSNDLSAFDVIWVSRSAPHTQLVVAVAGTGACVAGQAAVQAEGAQDVGGDVSSCTASTQE